GHGGGDEENLVRLDRIRNLLQLVHQFLIDLETACGIDDDGVVPVIGGMRERRFGDVDGILAAIRLEYVEAELAAEGLQLIDCGRPVNVCRYEQGRSFECFLEVAAELADRGRLTRALQADQHDDGGW